MEENTPLSWKDSPPLCIPIMEGFTPYHGRNHPHIMEETTPFAPSFMEGSRNFSVTFHGKKTFDFFLVFCTM
jgi:hypothetical protein